MTEAADILRRAKEFIQTKGWTQGAFARDYRGYALSPSIDMMRATCFCATGALIAAGRNAGERPYSSTHEFLERAMRLKSSSIAEWNDRKGRTKEQVVAAFDRAIALAESCP